MNFIKRISGSKKLSTKILYQQSRQLGFENKKLTKYCFLRNKFTIEVKLILRINLVLLKTRNNIAKIK
jgi:hypothetical protein